ncbi:MULTISPECIES: hypothetical protein [Helicobacter]|nr:MULTISPECIES: hypothetical protein [Helicobacter]BDQ28139.1 hypothetical protein ASB1_18150 [Helicobacter heilmannii]GLH58543.1 hypothetical protein NHP214376_13340 [Helicobacter ailurogastricus]GLH60029.1 hypothetical protein NHP214377_13010 [Helicobacter ailurogastricus]
MMSKMAQRMVFGVVWVICGCVGIFHYHNGSIGSIWDLWDYVLLGIGGLWFFYAFKAGVATWVWFERFLLWFPIVGVIILGLALVFRHFNG